MLAVSERLDEFSPASIAVVTFASVERLASHRDHLGAPFPLLADPTRILYRRFGLGRGSFSQVWNAGTLNRYRLLARRGRRIRLPIQDTRQLGGDFVIDGDRRVAAVFRPPSPDARPSVDALVAAVADCRS